MLANFMLQHDTHNSKLAHLVERKYDTKLANSGMIFNNMKTTEFGTYFTHYISFNRFLIVHYICLLQEQYIFCYRVMQDFVTSLSLYSTFL